MPNAVYVVCPQCDRIRSHEMLKGRFGNGEGGILECTVRCNECEFVHHEKIEVPEEIEIPMVVSDLGSSRKTTIRLEENAVLRVGEDLLLEDYPVKITSLEKDEKRVEECVVGDVATIWAKRYDRVKLGISVHRGNTTTAVYFLASPYEEIAVGDIVSVSGEEIAIIRIKTETDVLSQGLALANEIVRLYGRVVG